MDGIYGVVEANRTVATSITDVHFIGIRKHSTLKMIIAPVSIMYEYDFTIFYRTINGGRKPKSLPENEYFIFVGESNRYRGYSRYFHVANVEEIETLRNKITSKFLITTATCSAKDLNDQVVSEVVFVVVDTSDPFVSKMLHEAFDKAKQLMENGENFTVQFDLDQSIASWYLHYGDLGKNPKSVGAGFFSCSRNTITTRSRQAAEF